jgi:DNA-binding FadR family transcriptional regulator
MERMGLVSRAETELERMISLDLLPADRSLPSEQKLARCFGVSRATLREALLRLSARGLVVQHPGRKTRALVLDEAVTLESLSVTLHTDGRTHPDRWRLLEGYFSLKREMTVELLATCCEQASEVDLRRLEDACFALREAARWSEDRGGWAREEFALLRLAARAADRPGHFLLIQSLERSFWGMAERVLPHMDSEATQAWALCAFDALAEKNAQSLRRELPPLLQACDGRLLDRLAPADQTADTRESCPTVDAPPCDELALPESAAAGLSGAAAPNLSDCLTGSGSAPPTGEPQPQAPSNELGSEPACPVLETDGPPGHPESGAADRQSPPVLPLGCAPGAAPLLMAGSRPPWPRPWPHPWRPGMMAWLGPCSPQLAHGNSAVGPPWIWPDNGWLTLNLGWKSSTGERRPDE